MHCHQSASASVTRRHKAFGLCCTLAVYLTVVLSSGSFVASHAQNTTAAPPNAAYLVTPAKKHLPLKKVTIQRKAHTVTVQIVVRGKEPKSVAPAFKKGANLKTVVISFFDKNSDKTSGNSGAGEEHSFGSDELSGVTVSNRHPVNDGKLVEIEFKFEKIETTWVTGGKTASDDWTARE